MANSAQLDSTQDALDDILSAENVVKLFKKEREMFTAINNAYVSLAICIFQPRWIWHIDYLAARDKHFRWLGIKAQILTILQMGVFYVYLRAAPNASILRGVMNNLILSGIGLNTLATFAAVAKIIRIPRGPLSSAFAIVFAGLDISEDLERSLNAFKSNLNNINRQAALRNSNSCEDGEADAFSRFLNPLVEQHAKAQESLNSIDGQNNDSTLFHLSFYGGIFFFLLSLILLIVILFLRFTAMFRPEPSAFHITSLHDLAHVSNHQHLVSKSNLSSSL